MVKKILLKTGLVAMLCLNVVPDASAIGYATGTIRNVMAGADNWYGVRFFLNISSSDINGECNHLFFYTEPEPDSGHKNMVAVFTAAYLTNKTVTFTVIKGRNGFCKIVEGYMG